MTDEVKKPKHYKMNEGDIECIDYIRQVLGPEGFIHYCHGNLIKYQHRYKYKGKPLQDLEKGYEYIGWMIDAMKGADVKVSKPEVVVGANGSKSWYLKDKLHREDGPAVEWADGHKKWYLNGTSYTEAEWKDRLCQS